MRGRVVLRARAPAKVNLVLAVGGLRPDGYHDLATLMVPLDLSDEVRVEVSPGRRGDVTCRVPGRPDLDGSRNLAARAAEAFRRARGCTDRVAITIAKRIPVVAGLGGGSSDAAAVLRALARAYGVRSLASLVPPALEVGSDVPFFLSRGPAWVGGRGEAVEPVRVPTLDLVLVYPLDPALAIRAGDAYRWLDEARAAQGKAVGSPRISRLAWAPARARNDLERGCFDRHPLLGRLAGRLVRRGASVAIMSGSGPTVFGVFPGRAAARRAAGAMLEPGIPTEVHVVRTLQRHPGVSTWKSPRSASSRSARRSSRRT